MVSRLLLSFPTKLHYIRTSDDPLQASLILNKNGLIRLKQTRRNICGSSRVNRGDTSWAHDCLHGERPHVVLKIPDYVTLSDEADNPSSSHDGYL